ncbi:MAG TPA: hypothetical protein VFH80_19060, partial [Solirubrobacteraceae bacterium]|nr:hypothetical protein [Solirubrobacteraceae bacterium]
MADSVKVTVYDKTGATLLATFDSTSTGADHYGPLSVRWSDVLNSAGSGEVVLALADSAVTSTVVAYRNIVKVAVNGGADVYAFRVKNISRDHVASGETAAQRVSMSGPGLFDLLTDAVVYPEGGLRQSMTGRRSFGW